MQANLVDNNKWLGPAFTEEVGKSVCFFTASTKKFAIMSICTLGIYHIYWFYKNWDVLRDAGIKCMPVWRSIFAPFFSYSLFLQIKRTLVRNKVKMMFPIFSLFVIFFILIFTDLLPKHYNLISGLNFIPLILVNRAAIAANISSDSNFVVNNKFSKWNWVAIVVGGLMLVLAILGIFVTPTPTG